MISVKPSPETERPAANDSAMPGLEPVEPTPPDLDLPKNQGARWAQLTLFPRRGKQKAVSC